MAISVTDLQTMGIEVSDALKRGLVSDQPSMKGIVAQTVKMNTKSVECPIVHMVGPLREWLGSRYVESLSHDAYTITAKSFEKTVAIGREAVEDDNLDVYMPALETVGVQARLWPDQQLAAKLEAGESDTCFDKVAFFSASHPVDTADAGAGTFSNLTGSGSTAWYLLDSSKPVKPMIWGDRRSPEFVNLWNPEDPNVFFQNEYVSGVSARGVADFGLPHLIHKCKGALDSTNFEALESAMMSLTNGQGVSLNVRPDTLLVPSSLYADARALIESQFLASGASNPLFKRVKVVVWQDLSNS